MSHGWHKHLLNPLCTDLILRELSEFYVQIVANGLGITNAKRLLSRTVGDKKGREAIH